MVLREWRACAGNDLASLYPQHFREVVLPKLRELDGFVAATLSARKRDGQVEFLVLTRWQSLECVHKFTGPDLFKAVVEPAAARLLSSYDHAVRHYEVLEAAGPEPAGPEAAGPEPAAPPG